MNAGPIADPMAPELYQVQRVRREIKDVFTLELATEMGPRPSAGIGETHFLPGQFNMLYAFGAGEVPISISGDPARTSSLIHTVRSVGAVSQALCRLRRGQTVGLRGPFGSPWPMDAAEAHDVLFIAGGLGLAPLRPAIYSCLSQREKYGRVFVLYGARSPSDLLYNRELRTWRARFDLEVEITVDLASADWRGHVGVVPRLIFRAAFDPLRTIAFVCGPEVMMRFTIQELVKQGLAPEQVYISLERNMKCAIGFCGHCQLGPSFICKDGPVMRYDSVQPFFGIREL